MYRNAWYNKWLGHYIDYIAVGEQEHSVVSLDPRTEADFLEIVSEVSETISPGQGQFDQCTLGQEGRQLDCGRLTNTVQTNLQHIIWAIEDYPNINTVHNNTWLSPVHYHY